MPITMDRYSALAAVHALRSERLLWNRQPPLNVRTRLKVAFMADNRQERAQSRHSDLQDLKGDNRSREIVGASRLLRL